MRISQETRNKAFERDNHICQSCGMRLDKKMAQLHHIVPMSKGGTNDLSNLTTLCANCHYSIADKFLYIATTPVSKKLAEKWFETYKKAPAITSIISVIIAIVGIMTGVYFDHQQKIKQELERKENLNYHTQIEQLNDTEENINQLLNFVKQQRVNLKATQTTLDSLKTEKEKLEPLVESDRKVVKALFNAQEERNRSEISRERWIGFGLGILASILASTILMVIRSFVSKGKFNKKNK